MRLLVARCEVTYTGRLDAFLPEAVRLLMIKSDGSVLVHADSGGYRPSNWMTPPTVIEESDELIVVRKRAGKTEDRLEIRIVEVLSGPGARDGRDRRPREGRGREASAGGARRRARVARGRAPARTARVDDRDRACRPDVPRLRRRLGRGRDQAGRDDRGGRAADALLGFIRADPARPPAAASSRRSRSSRRR